jgi:hypothetical protein
MSLTFGVVTLSALRSPSKILQCRGYAMRTAAFVGGGAGQEHLSADWPAEVKAR